VQKIDSEIRRLVEEGYRQATKILIDKRADLETLAKGLLEYETLTGKEIKDLLDGRQPRSDEPPGRRAGSSNEEAASVGTVDEGMGPLPIPAL
jgi:cell division protease FtsH